MASSLSLSTSHNSSPPPQFTAIEQELLQEYAKLVTNMNTVILSKRRVLTSGVFLNSGHGKSANVPNSGFSEVFGTEDWLGVYILQG
jgi:hypothetical protein